MATFGDWAFMSRADFSVTRSDAATGLRSFVISSVLSGISSLGTLRFMLSPSHTKLAISFVLFETLAFRGRAGDSLGRGLLT